MTLAGRYEYADYPDAIEDYFERGFTDGLPVVPPTPEAVAAMLTAGGLSGDQVLGEVPTRDVVVTAEKAAVNSGHGWLPSGLFPQSWPPPSGPSCTGWPMPTAPQRRWPGRRTP